MVFFVKARIDLKKFAANSQKLQAGEIPTHPLRIYCLQDDPAVGLNIWEAGNQDEFEQAFDLKREFYIEIIVVNPVDTRLESMKLHLHQAGGPE